MQDAIARLLGMEPGAISVKASTGNLGGDEGAGRRLSANAIAILGEVPPSGKTR
jgi:2C-methyl-D-erythritol 2,4-cyclodiphosphate synthase